MSVKRNGRTSKLRGLRMSSPHKATVRAFLRSAPGSRRSFADDVSCPLRCTRRTSKPCRLRRLRNDRIARRISFCHKASFPPRGAPGGNPHKRRRPRRVFVRRKSCRARLPTARACASTPSRAPCGGGSRGPSHRKRIPRFFARGIGRVQRPGLFRGRSRTDCARARENPGHTSGITLVPGAIQPSACGVRVHKRVLLPDPYGAWLPPRVESPCGRCLAGKMSWVLIPGTASFPTRGVRPRAAARFRESAVPCRR